MFEQAAIIGDGQMGTVMAIVLADQGMRVRLWSRNPERSTQLRAAHENRKYLPGVPIPDRVSFTSDPHAVLIGADFAVSAVPCQHMRPVWSRFASAFPRDLPIVSVAKGIEIETLMRPSEILRDLLGRTHVAALSGPSIARELAQRLPATMVAACENHALAEQVQQAFATPWLRVYTNPDLLGVELAGALKNVIALAAGIIDGLRAGDNAKAALVTRGLVEMTRLGVAMGARRETFAGLAGLGDLVTTCVSPSGRNRTAGEAIGRGRPVDQVIASVAGVIEGIPTAGAALTLARRHGVEMPITAAVHDVLCGGKDLLCALTELMSRDLRGED